MKLFPLVILLRVLLTDYLPFPSVTMALISNSLEPNEGLSRLSGLYVLREKKEYPYYFSPALTIAMFSLKIRSLSLMSCFRLTNSC